MRNYRTGLLGGRAAGATPVLGWLLVFIMQVVRFDATWESPALSPPAAAQDPVNVTCSFIKNGRVPSFSRRGRRTIGGLKIAGERAIPFRESADPDCVGGAMLDKVYFDGLEGASEFARREDRRSEDGNRNQPIPRRGQQQPVDGGETSSSWHFFGSLFVVTRRQGCRRSFGRS